MARLGFGAPFPERREPDAERLYHRPHHRHRPRAYAEYVKDATEAIRQYGGQPLVRGGTVEQLEGEARPRNVVIEFESLEQAKRYYHSPEYQAAKKKREGAGRAESSRSREPES